jgi:antitoxin HigA-1
MAKVGTIEPDHIAFASIGNGASIGTARRERRMSRTAIHPGQFLRDELDELRLSAAELARRIHVPAKRVSQILAGKRDVTANTALRLGRWFGTGPDIWLNLQKAYELDLARQELGDAIDAIEPRVAA